MLTSRMDMNRRQSVLKDLINRYPKKDVPLPNEQFWEMLQTVIEARNKIAHGVWVTAKGRPAIASTKWKAKKDFMAIEIYPYDKIYTVELLAEATDETLKIYAQNCGLQHITFAAPRQSNVVIHPPDHQ